MGGLLESALPAHGSHLFRIQKLTSRWQPEIDHGGRIYTMGISTYYRGPNLLIYLLIYLGQKKPDFKHLPAYPR